MLHVREVQPTVITAARPTAARNDDKMHLWCHYPAWKI